MDLVSVVVPVYRVEPYLDRCIKSIVNQTYTNLEIILVDDGSPDRCPQICDEWAAKDSRIRVVHKENGGLSDARNAGIALANGGFLAFVDSDDYIARDMYEIMISALQRTGAGMVCCGVNISKDGDVRSCRCIRQEKVFTSEDALRELVLDGCIGQTACNKVYRKSLFGDIAFPKGEINEDLAVMPQLIDQAGTVCHVGVPLYFYYQNRGSVTKSPYSPQKKIVLQHLDDLENYLRTNHPNLLPDLVVLQASLCRDMIPYLLANPQIKRDYYSDYQVFYERFCKYFRKSLQVRRMGIRQRLKGELIYYRVYYLLHELKRKVGKKREIYDGW